MNPFLPLSYDEMNQRGWDKPDFVLVTGDAYVDHPSFGAAIIARYLESLSYKVAILAQPDFKNTEDFLTYPRPRLGFLVTSGNIDSMVAHYTAAKRPRSTDAYSPGGKMGLRPDRAVIVYCNRIREAFPGMAIILGGLEASLRRFSHYDYWDDAVRRSVLIDSSADILTYGMGERAIGEIANYLGSGLAINEIPPVRGTCVIKKDPPPDAVFCPPFERVAKDKQAFLKSFKIQYDECDAVRGKTVVEPYGLRYLVQYPPAPPLEEGELDRVYALPFTRLPHPKYENEGGVPATEEVEFSIASSRGCFGACNFCSLAFHQGKMVTSRSHDSIISEAEGFLESPRFKGFISDVGGPTANFRAPSCEKQKKAGLCKDRSCLSPVACKNLNVSHEDYLSLLRKLRKIPKIKKVFIRSGIRYDYLMEDKNPAFFKELLEHHISGQLKVAPEHCSGKVLSYMGKPSFDVYKRFSERYKKENERIGKKQFLVPYLMSSHPGSTLSDAIELSLYLKEAGLRPQQVQDFYPTPGTLSTCMFYTGIDPRTGKEVYVPKTSKEKKLQRALLQPEKPENRMLVLEALKLAGREDLIGFKKGCLIAPMPGERRGASPSKGRRASYASRNDKIISAKKTKYR